MDLLVRCEQLTLVGPPRAGAEAFAADWIVDVADGRTIAVEVTELYDTDLKRALTRAEQLFAREVEELLRAAGFRGYVNLRSRRRDWANRPDRDAQLARCAAVEVVVSEVLALGPVKNLLSIDVERLRTRGVPWFYAILVAPTERRDVVVDPTLRGQYLGRPWERTLIDPRIASKEPKVEKYRCGVDEAWLVLGTGAEFSQPVRAGEFEVAPMKTHFDRIVLADLSTGRCQELPVRAVADGESSDGSRGGRARRPIGRE